MYFAPKSPLAHRFIHPVRYHPKGAEQIILKGSHLYESHPCGVAVS